MNDHTRALLAEACGTFWFVFIAAGGILADNVVGGTGLVPAALAYGGALAIAMSAFGAMSGGHFNPALTLGLAIGGKHPWRRVPTYGIAQLVGGAIAGFALRYVFDSMIAAVDRTHLGTPALGSAVAPTTGIVVEAILTLFLVWAMYGTLGSPLAPRIGGLGVGLAAVTDVLVGGPLTGAAMNPARWFATAVPASFYDNWYVYWIGPLLGALIGGLTVRVVSGPARSAEEDRAAERR